MKSMKDGFASTVVGEVGYVQCYTAKGDKRSLSGRSFEKADRTQGKRIILLLPVGEPRPSPS